MTIHSRMCSRNHALRIGCIMANRTPFLACLQQHCTVEQRGPSSSVAVVIWAGVRAAASNLNTVVSLCLQTTTGVTSDLRQAARYARHMVAECGMSEELVSACKN